MKRIARLIFPLIFVLICEVNGARRTKPSKKRPTPSLPEPVEPTEFPPPLPPGPPSVFPDCPRECFCPPDFPLAIYCDSRNLRKVPLIPPRAQHVYLQNNFIDKLSEESFKNATGLRWISLDNNRIDSVGSQVLQKLENLVFLYMEKNFLKEVPNNLPPNLEQLRLSRNRISKIPENVFSKLDHLLLLDLHHNQLDNGDFKKNTFKGLKNLMQLNLAHNRLSKMPPGVPKAIHQLFLDKNQIDNIPNNYFKDFSNLAFIRLNYNKLSDKGLPLDTFNITNLLVLHLAYNNLTSIPYISPRLEHLYLNDNSIQKINGTQICPTGLVSLHAASSDLENAPRLRYLRLDGNLLKPPIPLDLMLCFRLLQSVIF